jgi:hypothetical protein
MLRTVAGENVRLLHDTRRMRQIFDLNWRLI